MTGSEVRKQFLDFFTEKKHPVSASDSLVPAADPTLLFTGAGMNQFKDYFLGVKKDLKRAASCQKCFRTGDVDQVGKTASHLTFFEMLGNFSFGDYFKSEAIRWGWEFMTQRLELPPERLWASVYEEDDEAAQIWAKEIGLPKERIVRFGAKDNFWPSDAPTQGPNGPCGPCSEIYYDYGRSAPGKTCPNPDRCSPACSCGRFVEIWNLVFTQFDRQPDGSLAPLPSKNIDTGMGLERLTAVMQGKASVFETDLFCPMVEALADLLRDAGAKPVSQAQRPLAYAIVDHVRALTFLIADGVVPSNDGRGYVLRMLLRRAARHGIGLGLKDPFLYRLVPVVTQVMEKAYPELTERRESIARAVLTEEERFHRMLAEKIPLLLGQIQKIKQGKGSRQDQAAQLVEAGARFYDTHGLSYEEIAEACQKEKLTPPERGDFDKAVATLQADSKAKSRFEGDIFAGDEIAELAHQVAQSTPFLGYDKLTLKTNVVGLIQGTQLVETVKGPDEVGIILDRSVFYGEAGGQIGDAGTLEGPQGKLQVLDVQWVGNVLLHRAMLTEGKIAVGDPVKAQVDAARRHKVAQNHTATHLLHAALRRVVGSHVVQAGSLVASDHLRFDFSHGQALSASQRESVESLANEWIEARYAVSIRQMPLTAARAAGALALFGEKYSDQVRVVSIGEVSKELCGGTHLHATDEVGFLTIVEEGSVAAGMRRIKALSNQVALDEHKAETAARQEEIERLRKRTGKSPGKKAKAGLRKTGSALQRLAAFKAERAEQEEEIDQLKGKIKDQESEQRRREVEGAHEKAEALLDGKMEIGLITFVGEKLEEPMQHAVLRSMADAIRKKESKAIIFLSDQNGFCVAVSSDEAQQAGVLADEMLKLAAEIAGGSGGGRANMAQGRIQDPSKFQQVRTRLQEYIQEKVQA